MSGPLAGYKVLDLSRILAGPWASQMLADLGANVIKIERPGAGDDTRQWGPPYLKNKDGSNTSDAAYFFCANRGKQSVTVDITQAEGQEIIRQLASQCDVLIENYKVGGLAKYGLDYPSLQQLNPQLVYCSITGFGQTGPYAERPGYDFLIQGMAGLMSLTGEPDNEGGNPVKVGVAVTDLLTGLYAANAIQGALLERNKSGQSNSARVENRQQLCTQISKLLAKRSSEDWLAAFEQQQIPCGPINNLEQVFKDPQVLARNMLVNIEERRSGDLALAANPINYSRSQINYSVPPPELGSSTESILSNYLEYSAMDIAELRGRSII